MRLTLDSRCQEMLAAAPVFAHCLAMVARDNRPELASFLAELTLASRTGRLPSALRAARLARAPLDRPGTICGTPQETVSPEAIEIACRESDRLRKAS